LAEITSCSRAHIATHEVFVMFLSTESILSSELLGIIKRLTT